MTRILNVAEKNDAAKSLSDIMSSGRYSKVSFIFSHVLFEIFVNGDTDKFRGFRLTAETDEGLFSVTII